MHAYYLLNLVAQFVGPSGTQSSPGKCRVLRATPLSRSARCRDRLLLPAGFETSKRVRDQSSRAADLAVVLHAQRAKFCGLRL
jgi:hypothetical protein